MLATTRRKLNGLKATLDQFQSAVEQGAAGRLGHVGATAELEVVSEQVVPETMAAWESASSVVWPSRPADENTPSPTPPAGGEVRPAA